MTCKRLSFIWLASLCLAGCAVAPQVSLEDREPVAGVQPLERPAWPNASLVRCPRGDWDPEAICPWGSEWIGYDAAGADGLEAFAVAGKANTRIAQANADAVDELNTEAERRNETAAALGQTITEERRGRWFERLGFASVLTLVVLVAL